MFCAARRYDLVRALADEIDGVALKCDVTSDVDVAELGMAVGGRCDVLVNNAGGAIGLEDVADADIDAWTRMYAVNVLGAARVTKALLPAIEASEGTVVFITSVAADGGYEGGAGYCGVKAAERSIAQSLRLELFGRPVRVCEIVPGLVRTEGFSLTRFAGDHARADAVYDGVPGPLVAEDIADCVAFVATRPAHVNIDRLTVRPRAQAAQHKLFRTG